MKRVLVLLLCATAALGQQNTRGGAAGTGSYAVQPLRTEPKIVWEARPGFRDYGAMVVSGDTVVTGNTTGTGGTFAFSATTGKKLWSLPNQMWGEPTVDSKAAYVVNRDPTTDARLSSVDLKTGKILWVVKDDALGEDESAPVLMGGRLYIVNRRGTLRSYDAASGKPIWSFTYSGGKSNCPTGAVVANGLVYFGGTDEVGNKGPFLWAVDAATGKQAWRYKAGVETNSNGECVSPAALAYGVVVVTAKRVLYALDAQSGNLLWKKQGMRTVKGEQKPEDLSEPIIANGIVYAFMQDGLTGWELKSGKAVFDLPGKFTVDAGVSRMAEAGGVLYVLANLPGNDGADAPFRPLNAVDVASGKILWTHRVNRPSAPNLDTNQWRTLFVLPDEGALYYENKSILVKLQ